MTDEPNRTPQLVDTKTAAKILCVSPNYLRKRRFEGYLPGHLNLPYVIVGRAVRYRLDDLRAFIESNHVTPTNPHETAPARGRRGETRVGRRGEV